MINHGIISEESVNVHGRIKQKVKKHLPYTLTNNTSSLNSKKKEEYNTDKEEKKIPKNEEKFPTEKSIENFELPEVKIGAVIQLFKIAKQTDITTEQVFCVIEPTAAKVVTVESGLKNK